MTTIQDRIIKDFKEKYSYIKECNCQGEIWHTEEAHIQEFNDLEQFLIQSIKLVEEETRKETKLSLENKWKEKIKASDNPWEGLTIMDINEVFNNLSITNKESKNG